ncbi:uncharacterized protein BXZ73DRAFT_39598, partial [Epithele typhae]|uniref:uncharacterized protein n=1 Tax=Epithele typhae TaxID=378194 RepID=UPI002008AF0B
PSIDGEAMLEIFVHASIRFAGLPMNSNSPYGDGHRLRVIGSKMLEAAFLSAIFDQTPMKTGEDMEAEIKNLDQRVDKWVEGYKWREKVRHGKDVDMRSQAETRALMDAYVGAVFVGSGFTAVLNWISALVDPSAPPKAQPGAPDVKRTRMDSPFTGNPMGYTPYPSQHFPSSPGYAPSPPSMHPPPPPGMPPPLPPMSGQPQSTFLPLFNQTAQQRRIEVQYPAQFSGPPHAGRWTVQCLVNGDVKGTGTGPSKQLAKEEAARQAYHAMGWAPRMLGISTSGVFADIKDQESECSPRP